MINSKFITAGTVTISIDSIKLIRPKDDGLEIITDVLDPVTQIAITFNINADNSAIINEYISTISNRVY